MPAPVTLDGRSLSIEDVVAVARDGAAVAIAPRALDAVRASRRNVTAVCVKPTHTVIPRRNRLRSGMASSASSAGRPIRR